MGHASPIGKRLAEKADVSEPVWGLILAGGSGRRLAQHTGGIPKQFFSVSDGPSLLDDTVNRLTSLAAPDRTVIVVDRSHRRHIEALTGPSRQVGFVYQPGNRGTAAGVLLGVSAIAERDPDAVMLMTPADHGVRDVGLFEQGVRVAVAAVVEDDARVVLFGIEPDRLAGDYGWIVPGRPSSVRALRTVARFVEKPGPELAGRLFIAGAVWNTMVLVARAATVLELFGRHQPELTALFQLHTTMPRMLRERFLADRYPLIPSIDFSHDVLTPAARAMTVFTWPAAMGWSDLGTPERLTMWLGSRLMSELAS
jgi:mannose-1-phosphate guanylyltransferase